MRILGLDVSTKLGWGIADLTDNRVTLYGDEYLYTERGIALVRAMNRDIRVLLRERQPNAVFIEGYSYASRHMIVTMVEIGAGVRLDLQAMGIPTYEVAPSTLKTIIAGKGNCGKTKVMMSLFKDYGFETENDNVADGVSLAIIGLYKLIGLAGVQGTTISTGAKFPQKIQQNQQLGLSKIRHIF